MPAYFSRRDTQPPVRTTRSTGKSKLIRTRRRRAKRPIRFRGGVSKLSKSNYSKGAKLATNLTDLGIIEKKLHYHTQQNVSTNMIYKMSSAIKYANYVLGQSGVAGEDNYTLGVFNQLFQGSSPQQVQGDYVMVKHISGELKIMLPPVAYTQTNLGLDVQRYQPRRFRVLLVMPKLREQAPGQVFSTTDSLFIDRIGREWGIEGTDTTTYLSTSYKKTQEELMTGLVNKQKWIVLKDQKFMLDNPYVQQYYSSTGTHSTGTYGSSALPTGGLDDFLITTNASGTTANVGGYSNFPFMQRTGRHPSTKTIKINIPVNKKVKMENVSGVLNPQNLPVLACRLIIMSDYPQVNRVKNEQINVDTPIGDIATYITYSGTTSFLDA